MKLYNTLSRSIEEFKPLAPPAVSLYVCGPTVYDIPHIGHARSAYTFDLLRRYLEFKKYKVTFVRNVTDVDDKIIDRARQELGAGDLNAECRKVSEKYLKSYHETMGKLGILAPDIEPKATEHVNTLPKGGFGSMTDLIGKLLTQGVAYEAKGDVYFAVRKFPGYGKLSNRTLDELQAGSRVEPGEGKQDPMDFALWKAAKPGEPSWKSPWGDGRPGWHIECSAMSTHYLGDSFDIHGGGVDLVFPHHENEVAQAQAAGKPFARYWVHNGLLTVNGEKMSKSLKNYLTVEQVLEKYTEPSYLKLFFLKTHYRSPVDYSHEKMDEAKKNYQEFQRFFQHYYQRTLSGEQPAQLKSQDVENAIDPFLGAMDDDLNTPKALAVLFDLVNSGQRALESGGVNGLTPATVVFHAITRCGETLGLFNYRLPRDEQVLVQHVQALLKERETARKEKNFRRADAIREQLQKEGYVLEDTAGGPLVHRVRE